MSRKRRLSVGEVSASSRGKLGAASTDDDLPRSSEMSVQETSGNTRRPGHSYSGITMSDQSRNQLGDTIIVHHHISPLSSEEVQKARFEEFKEAPAFKRMDYRRADITPAYAETCQWIFRESAFLRWRDPTYGKTNHGFFWIKGKPGSGKSTIMRLVLEHLQKETPTSTIVSFFFNARGHALERTAKGCYRSLLYQLLISVTTLRTSIALPTCFAKGQTWERAVVQEILRQAIRALPGERTVLLIDALDECNEIEVPDIVDFVDDLTQNMRTFHACFASRHYPSVTLRFGEELVLEDSDSHTLDITRYIECRLHVRRESARAALAERLMRKSQGVFIWVVLAIRSINEQYDRGEDDAQLLASFSTVPSALEALISMILSARSGPPDRFLFPIMFWTLAAHPEMTLEEMYTAIKSAAGLPHSLHDSHFRKIKWHSLSFKRPEVSLRSLTTLTQW